MWLENWDTVRAFLAVSTQWNVVSIGGGLAPAQTYWIGLNYPGVEVGLRSAGIDATPELWTGLRVMEAAAKASLNGHTETD